MIEVVYIGNTNIVRLNGLRDDAAVFINDATVELTITREGVEIPGETWPKAMGYVENSDGKYEAALSYDIPWASGTHVAVVTVNAGSNRRGTWNLRFSPKVRKES